ncbi:flavodoxin family protein [Adlercreutzia muris]|uniref:Flavodoxin family protein n=1 Tax=Adlercreutzia muris TaxID=1796610 RepID=A0A7C8FXA9_9ACTN|nr:flavodoxin family protein [Adlercreutzia muris]KAB1650815.1 flavodoxin family protein [Adlercreutzia muris]MCR2027231.1 flavodoxin family protein [Adlercreutzia muris]MCU7585264.1 flavodoxin family protein [Adlercreutzia muris]
MKVLLINGSPRMQGNTNRALEEVAAALEAEGVQTELVWIGNKEIRGCIACGICGKKGDNRCVFDSDPCNGLIQKAAAADGLIVGSPVYYAGAAGTLVGLLDRMFYAGGSLLRFKPAAGIAVARRAGTIEAADQINKYFQINNMPVVPSSYWNIAFGRVPGDVEGDGEGLHTMRTLGRNMAWMLRCIEAGREAGVTPPEIEPKTWTHYVREDVLEG